MNRSHDPSSATLVRARVRGQVITRTRGVGFDTTSYSIESRPGLICADRAVTERDWR
jgi:hypothetical protein